MANTGKSYALTLKVTVKQGGNVVETQSYSILDAFGSYSAITETRYKGLSNTDQAIRTNAFMQYVAALHSASTYIVLGEPVTEDLTNCPLPPLSFLYALEWKDRVCQIEPGNASIVATEKSSGSWHNPVVMGQNGKLYFTTGSATSGLWYLDDDGIIKAVDGLGSEVYIPLRGGIAQDGRLYFGSTANIGIYYLNNEGLLNVTNIQTGQWLDSGMGQDGKLYFCGPQGIYRLDNDGQIRSVKSRSTSSTFYVVGMGQDNKLYFSYDGNLGIFYLDNDGVIKQTNITTGKYDPFGMIGQDNKLYFGSEGIGIWYLDNDGQIKQTNITTGTYIGAGIGQDNKLYFSSDSNTGIWYLDTDGQIKQTNITTGGYTFYGAMSSSGKLYFATNHGIYYLSGVNSSGKSNGSTLTLYTQDLSGVTLAETDFSVLMAFEEYDALTEIEYSNLTSLQVAQRTDAFIQYICSTWNIREYTLINQATVTDTERCKQGGATHEFEWSDQSCQELPDTIISNNNNQGNYQWAVMGPDGKLYFSTETDISYLDHDGLIHNFSTTFAFRCAATGQDGQLYLCSDNDLGIRRLGDDGTIKPTNISTGTFISVATGHDGKLYFGSAYDGVWYLDNDGIIKQTNLTSGNIWRIGYSQVTTSLYFARQANGIYFLDDDGLIKSTNLTDGTCPLIATGQDYKLYFCFMSVRYGLWYLDNDGDIKPTNKTSGLFYCAAIAQQIDGRLYFGSDGSGIWYLDNDGDIKPTNKTDGTFVSVAAGQDGKLYFGSENSGIWYLDRDFEIKKIQTPSLTSSADVDVAAIGQDGKLYFGTTDGVQHLELGYETGTAIRQTLKLSTRDAGTVTSINSYSILDAFSTYSAITQEAYLLLSNPEITTRANALIAYIASQLSLPSYTTKNTVLGLNSDLCPIPSTYSYGEADGYKCLITSGTWSATNITGGTYISAGIGQDNKLYFGSTGNTGIWYLDNDGQIKQTSITTGSFYAGTLGQDGKLYIGSTNNTGIYFLDNDGQIKQTNITTGSFQSSTIGQDGKLYYFSSSSNTGIYFLDNDGQIKQTNITTGSFQSGTIGQDGKLYIGSSDIGGILYLDNDGQIKQTNETTGYFFPGAIGQDNKLYFGSTGDGIYFLDDDGIIKQTNKTDGSFYDCTVGQDNKLYFGSTNNTGIYFLDNDGQIKQTNITTGSFQSNAIMGQDNKLYYCSSSSNTGIYRLNTSNIGMAAAALLRITEAENTDHYNRIYPLIDNEYLRAAGIPAITLQQFKTLSQADVQNRFNVTLTGYRAEHGTSFGASAILDITGLLLADVEKCPVEAGNVISTFTWMRWFCPGGFPNYAYGNSLNLRMIDGTTGGIIHEDSLNFIQAFGSWPELPLSDSSLTDNMPPATAQARADAMVAYMVAQYGIISYTILNSFLRENDGYCGVQTPYYEIDWLNYSCTAGAKAVAVAPNHDTSYNYTTCGFNKFDNKTYFGRYLNDTTNPGICQLGDDGVISELPASANMDMRDPTFICTGQTGRLFVFSDFGAKRYLYTDDSGATFAKGTSMSVTDYLMGPDNKLYVAAISGLYRLEDDNSFTKLSSSYFHLLVLGPDNRIYYRTTSTVGRIENDGTLTRIQSGLHTNYDIAFVAQDGVLYFLMEGIFSDSVYYLRDDDTIQLISNTAYAKKGTFRPYSTSPNAQYSAFGPDGKLYYIGYFQTNYFDSTDKNNPVIKTVVGAPGYSFNGIVKGADGLLYFYGSAANGPVYVLSGSGVVERIKRNYSSLSELSQAVLGQNKKLYFTYYLGVVGSCPINTIIGTTLSGQAVASLLRLTTVSGSVPTKEYFSILQSFVDGTTSYGALTEAAYLNLSLADQEKRTNAFVQYIKTLKSIPEGSLQIYGEAIRTDSLLCPEDGPAPKWMMLLLPTPPVNVSWTCVASNGNVNATKFVAIGQGGVMADPVAFLYTSSDILTWVKIDLPVSAAWVSVASNGGSIWVAVSATAMIRSTDNGVTWSQVSGSSTTTFRVINYGNGVFMGLGTGNRDLRISSDLGVTWTASQLPYASSWRHVFYGSGLWIAVSLNRIIYSTDGGSTWVSAVNNSSWTFYHGCYSPQLNMWVVTGYDRIAYSTNGSSWSYVTTETGYFYDVAWTIVEGSNTGIFVITVLGARYTLVSADGINWVQEALPYAGQWTTVTGGQYRFIQLVQGCAPDCTYATYRTPGK